MKNMSENEKNLLHQGIVKASINKDFTNYVRKQIGKTNENITVVKSYYIIKVSSFIEKEIGKKDLYIIEDFDKNIKDKKKILTDDVEKAHKFQYFGLISMENTLTTVMFKINVLKPVVEKELKRKDFTFTVVGGDIYDNINEFGVGSKYNEYIYNRRNFILWENVANDETIRGMLETSKEQDENEETTYNESYVSIAKFLHHIKMLNYRDIMEVANNWRALSVEHQIELAFGYAGEYNLSRFLILMDYLSSPISSKGKKEN